MGCTYSRENRCFSLSCCFCFEPRNACYCIGAVGLVWGGFATNIDFISAYLPRQPCTHCLDYEFHASLCYVSGWINAVQWIMSIILIHGARKEVRWLVLLWLVWSVVSLLMLASWIAITLPYFPSMRNFFSLFQLVWGIHYYIVVKTHYTMLTLSFTPPEGPLRRVPPNSPTMKHKRRKRRLDPSTQPPIRTLVGVASKLQYDLNNKKRPKVINEEDEPEVTVISRTEDPEVGQRGHTAREALDEGRGATGPAQGPSCRPKISGSDNDGARGTTHDKIGHKPLRKPGHRSPREKMVEGREGGRSSGDGKARRRRREEDRGTREDQEEVEGRGTHRRRRRRREAAETRDDSITGVTGEGASSVMASGGASSVMASGGPSSVMASGGPSSVMASGGASSVMTSGGPSSVMASGGPSSVMASGGPSSVMASGGPSSVMVPGEPSSVMASGGPSSVTQADSLHQKVRIDTGSLQESPLPEGQSRYPAVPQEMSHHSTPSLTPSTDPSKPEGIARDPTVSTRVSSESPGLSRDPSPAQETARHLSSCPSEGTSQSPHLSGEVSSSPGDLSESPTVQIKDFSPSP